MFQFGFNDPVVGRVLGAFVGAIAIVSLLSFIFA